MNIANLGNTISPVLSFERIANLPKEIFQAQSELNSKLIKLNVLQNVTEKEPGQAKQILDIYA
ncbi:MAG: hypothetical protein L6Q54_12310 [Leptospiraceae bacterium]|nr:hypothetical protein [Leptospiraceae bacterium]MCK6382015.1 hypothetical protein [Leptospiraceae bacterium]NUM40386.1 hypothetical protein [Leptospiraceae bacterium]